MKVDDQVTYKPGEHKRQGECGVVVGVEGEQVFVLFPGFTKPLACDSELLMKVGRQPNQRITDLYRCQRAGGTATPKQWANAWAEAQEELDPEIYAAFLARYDRETDPVHQCWSDKSGTSIWREAYLSPVDRKILTRYSLQPMKWEIFTYDEGILQLAR